MQSCCGVASRKFFVVGNWKMNGTQKEICEIVKFMKKGPIDPEAEVLVGVPAPYLNQVRQALPPTIEIAAQNCYKEAKGNFTGEISPVMVKDQCANWVIVGHSERRQLFHEDDQLVAEKAGQALNIGLGIIACVGDTLEQRECGETEAAIGKQLQAIACKVCKDAWPRVVIAYEPIWTFGTGKTASPEEVQDVHEMIRHWLTEHVSPEVGNATRIIYGGTVNSCNCKELAALADVDGFLVGSTSLKPEFLCIVNAHQQ